MNKDLILREKLAIERTKMANQSTLLAFLRTAMYFFVAGLSINQLLEFNQKHLVSIIMYIFSLILLIYGFAHFFKQKKWIKNQYKHIGAYQLEYTNS